MKTTSKVIAILCIVVALAIAIVSLAIGNTAGIIITAALLILGLLVLIKARKGDYEIDYVVNAGHKTRRKMILVIHYKSGRIKTKYVRTGSALFNTYAKYIK